MRGEGFGLASSPTTALLRYITPDVVHVMMEESYCFWRSRSEIPCRGKDMPNWLKELGFSYFTSLVKHILLTLVKR